MTVRRVEKYDIGRKVLSLQSPDHARQIVLENLVALVDAQILQVLLNQLSCGG